MQIDYIRLSRALLRIAAHVRFIQGLGSFAFSVPNSLISESAKEKCNYATMWPIVGNGARGLTWDLSWANGL
jgi:hypothetical protein